MQKIVHCPFHNIWGIHPSSFSLCDQRTPLVRAFGGFSVRIVHALRFSGNCSVEWISTWGMKRPSSEIGPLVSNESHWGPNKRRALDWRCVFNPTIMRSSLPMSGWFLFESWSTEPLQWINGCSQGDYSSQTDTSSILHLKCVPSSCFREIETIHIVEQ